MHDMSPDYDVAIIGGGLAGLTLALQLHQGSPDLSIVVLERNSLPPPMAAHKVGESTVEVGAHYLSDTLGLQDLLERTQLKKFGLRFFFGSGVQDDISDADELGTSELLPVTSYQLDRGKLEGDLAKILHERGIVVQDEAIVKRVTISDDGGAHNIQVKRNGEAGSIRCRWMIDAGSRAALLKRRLNIGMSCDHKMVAAWFRLDKSIALDDWSDSEAWRRRCNQPRRLSTNHLMGSGYWAWIIPLAEDKTSVGLVADPDIHPLSSFSSFEKFSNWLSLHQPMLAGEVLDARDTLMDFMFRKNLSQDSNKVWSADRWALTGESGVFTDPFYSPGSDFIGISNTFVCDMIQRDRSDGQFATHAAVYEKMYMSFFASTMSLYEHLYQGFGDTRLMVLKTTWDYAFYRSVLAWLYFRNLMTDISFLRSVQPGLVAMRTLNEKMQAEFRKRAAERNVDEGRGRFIDQVAIPVLCDLQAALLQPAASPDKEISDNCRRLESLSPILLSLLVGSSSGGKGTCSLLGDLRQRLN